MAKDLFLAGRLSPLSVSPSLLPLTHAGCSRSSHCDSNGAPCQVSDSNRSGEKQKLEALETGSCSINLSVEGFFVRFFFTCSVIWIAKLNDFAAVLPSPGPAVAVLSPLAAISSMSCRYVVERSVHPMGQGSRQRVSSSSLLSCRARRPASFVIVTRLRTPTHTPDFPFIFSCL